VRRMEGLVFGLASSSISLAEFDVPRLRESQSFTQSGAVAAANAADLSARIHMSAGACLHGNFLLGQVHLYPASATLSTTRYGVAGALALAPNKPLSFRQRRPTRTASATSGLPPAMLGPARALQSSRT
jgi:hypothetical protein